MTLESDIGEDEFMSDPDGIDAFINEKVPQHNKNKVFGRNNAKDYQTLLIWTMLWINKTMKRLLTPMISLLALRNVYVMNEGEILWPESTSV